VQQHESAHDKDGLNARNTLYIQDLDEPQEKRPETKRAITLTVDNMKNEYDFSAMRSRPNPYAAKLKKPVTMRLSEDVVAHFKSMAAEAGVPYQSLINLYLRDCVMQNRRVQVSWPKAA
jgi:uncharacterized protein (DUF4415 family)